MHLPLMRTTRAVRVIPLDFSQYVVNPGLITLDLMDIINFVPCMLVVVLLGMETQKKCES
jgi:hypothetical protein